MLEPVKTVHRYQLVHDRLHSYIVVNRLKDGDPLPSEATLAQSLGVSRSAVREGLRGLTARGIVQTRPGVGSFVRALSLDHLLADLSYSLSFDDSTLGELREVRQILEEAYLPSVFARLQAADLEEITGAIKRIRARIARREPFVEEDAALHRATFRQAGNQVLLKLFDVLAESAHRDQPVFEERAPEKIEANLTAYGELLDAIAGNQLARALRALRAISTVDPWGVTEPVESVHRTIQEAIRRYIVVNGLRGADRLPSEPSLARALQVSRSAVREALRTLEAQGIIEVRVGRGSVVREYRLDQILGRYSYRLFDDERGLGELYEIRQHLEIHYVGTALERLTDGDLERLAALVAQMEARVEAGEDFTDDDVAFHRAMFVNANNRVLTKLFTLFAAVYRGARHLFRDRPSNEIRDDLLRHKNLLTILHTRSVGQVRIALADTFTALPSPLLQNLRSASVES